MPEPIYVLRHGETEWNRAGRMQGGLDSPLTATGRAQARTQARILARCVPAATALFTSPNGRTRATADILGAALGLVAAPDPRLSEIDMGAWQGRLRSDIRQEFPQLFGTPDPLEYYRHIPAGEAPEAVAGRLRAFLADLHGPAVIVTHGVTSRILRCLLLGRPVDDFSQLEGGQGVVFKLQTGQQERLAD